MAVFGDNALVLERHCITRERNHLGAQIAVQRIEGRSQQLLGGVFDQRGSPTVRAARGGIAISAGCPLCLGT